MVRWSASAFICATISTSPVRISVATQTTRPSTSNFGASVQPSSMSWVGAWSATALALIAAHHGDEAQLLVRIVTEYAAELRRDGERSGFLDTAQRHAG